MPALPVAGLHQVSWVRALPTIFLFIGLNFAGVVWGRHHFLELAGGDEFIDIGEVEFAHEGDFFGVGDAVLVDDVVGPGDDAGEGRGTRRWRGLGFGCGLGGGLVVAVEEFFEVEDALEEAVDEVEGLRGWLDGGEKGEGDGLKEIGDGGERSGGLAIYD